MSKISLIIKREYLTRIRKKSFIIMTILGPLLMGGLVAVSIYLAMQSQETTALVKVVDETGIIFEKLPESKSVVYEKDTMPIAIARAIFNSDRYYGILYIPQNSLNKPDSITFFTAKQPSPTVVAVIEKNLESIIEDHNFQKAGLNKDLLDSLKASLNILQRSVAPDAAEKEFSAGVTAGVGFVGGLLIYLFIFLYGVQVMRGVMEEKSSRIIEIMISSVKPFELMMGKIIGIALVGLTQFLLWVVLTMLITSIVSTAMTSHTEQAIEKTNLLQNEPATAINVMQNSNPSLGQTEIFKALGSLKIGKILFAFVFYFLGGYLLYSALFAAIGGAVDNETDTQQFMLPITIPLILAYIVAASVMANPESAIGYWFSIIPFTSPVVMMVRMPFDPPWIDLIISMAALIAGFIFTTWIAARIYRTGILMYGKKITWKELGKWLFYKS